MNANQKFEYLIARYGVGTEYLGMSNPSRRERMVLPIDRRESNRHIRSLDPILQNVDFDEFLFDFIDLEAIASRYCLRCDVEFCQGQIIRQFAIDHKNGREDLLSKNIRDVEPTTKYYPTLYIWPDDSVQRAEYVWQRTPLFCKTHYKKWTTIPTEQLTNRKPPNPDILNINIHETFGSVLSTRALNCLHYGGHHNSITTVGQLISLSERNLLGIRSLGITTLDEIKAKILEPLGLSLKV